MTEYVDCGSDRLGLHIYPPPNDQAPLAVVFPAMGVPARFYRSFAADLGAAGLWAAVADLRGTGASTPPASRASRYGYAELASDVGAVLDSVRDGRPTFLLGHSLGGQLCALHLAGASTSAATSAGAGSTVDGLVLVAVGLPYWRCYAGARRLAVAAYTQAIGATATALGVWPGWGFGGRQARGVIRDWAYTARHGSFPRRGGMRPAVESGLSTVRTPVFAVTVDDDRFTPPATTEALLAKLPTAPIERHHYTAAEAGAPLDHFRWARAGGPLAERIAAWAKAR